MLNLIRRHRRGPPSAMKTEPTAMDVPQLPTLWLLGKTGAGKSSLIQAVTGCTEVEIGNGFSPCTKTSQRYDFPPEKPLVRFLDTRGLAEADYDAGEDIAACARTTNAVILVMKAEDPEQGAVIKALEGIRKSGAIKHLLLVHTGILLLADEFERRQAINHNQQQVDTIWKQSVPSVAVDFAATADESTGIDSLLTALADLLPIIALLSTETDHADAEARRFAHYRKEILWYAAASGGTDVIPVVGLGTVPAIQAKMLHQLADRYDIEWNKKTFAEFFAALGTGFSIQYLSRLGVRQLVKLIPVYGQSIGSATAAAISFCSTYAIGRVACKYLYHKSKGERVSEQDLQSLYQQAFKDVRRVKDP